MATKTEMLNKLDDLTFWLANNPNHPDYSKVMRDKHELERRLAEASEKP